MVAVVLGRGAGDSPDGLDRTLDRLDHRVLLSLEAIDEHAIEGPIVVHHERDPVFLYPELAERGWQGEIVFEDEREVRLLVKRVDP